MKWLSVVMVILFKRARRTNVKHIVKGNIMWHCALSATPTMKIVKHIKTLLSSEHFTD